MPLYDGAAIAAGAALRVYGYQAFGSELMGCVTLAWAAVACIAA